MHYFFSRNAKKRKINRFRCRKPVLWYWQEYMHLKCNHAFRHRGLCLIIFIFDISIIAWRKIESGVGIYIVYILLFNRMQQHKMAENMKCTKVLATAVVCTTVFVQYIHLLHIITFLRHFLRQKTILHTNRWWNIFNLFLLL